MVKTLKSNLHHPPRLEYITGEDGEDGEDVLLLFNHVKNNNSVIKNTGNIFTIFTMLTTCTNLVSYHFLGLHHLHQFFKRFTLFQNKRESFADE